MEMISKMEESWIVDDVSSSDGGDLCSWEIINPSLSSSDSETLDFPLSSDSDSDTDSLPLSRKKPILIDRFGCNFSTLGTNRRIECHVDGPDEVEEEEEDDEIDDELVPRGVGARLERNRMRKVGKREYSKMARSKKLPSLYNRPGCVRGKHGLGLKHSLM